jgi:hypothetical protein
MRVNVYAEEMTDRVEIISKEIDGQRFTGLRLYLELPATVNGTQHQGPFIHQPGDDDSSAVTFWGKRDLRKVLYKMLAKLDLHYGQPMSLPTSDKEATVRARRAEEALGAEPKSASELASIAADLFLEASEPEPGVPTPPDCTCDRKGSPLFLHIDGKTNVSNHRQECPMYKYLYDLYASEK